MGNRHCLWLFDLDNTLHDASHAVFPAIKHNMNAFLLRVLAAEGKAADVEQANALRLAYFQQYGATLQGVVKHHDVHAEQFLDEVHRFDDLRAMLRSERGLRQVLSRLPGRKILLTNAPHRYALQVLRYLRLDRHFAAQISIEQMRVHGQMCPKPSRKFLRRLLAKERIPARRCVLVEDSLENLLAAKRIGMRTVWITRYALHNAAVRSRKKTAACVDQTVKSVQQLPRYWRNILIDSAHHS